MKQSGAENGAANTIPSLTASFDAESVRPLCAAEAARLSPTPADGAPEAIAAPAEHITETESERARDAAALAGRRPFLLGIISIPMTSHQHWLGCRHAATERERGFKSKTPKADRCSDASTRRTFCATLTHSETRFPRRNLASAPGARVSRRGFAPRAGVSRPAPQRSRGLARSIVYPARRRIGAQISLPRGGCFARPEALLLIFQQPP